MNENDLPGNVVSVGSSLAPEAVEKALETLNAINARHTNPNEAWEELKSTQLPDVTEFYRHTVTVRMDSDYSAYFQLTLGQSPDGSHAPDTLTVVHNSNSANIPVTFWSLPDGSGIGFWLDTEGQRSWHVLRSKTWQRLAIDTSQLSFPHLDAELPKVSMDISLTGEAGMVLFTQTTLERINARNSLLAVISPQARETPSCLVPGEITKQRQDFITSDMLTALLKDIQSGGSAHLQGRSRNIPEGLFTNGSATVAIWSPHDGYLTGEEYTKTARNDADPMASFLGQHLINQLRDIQLVSSLNSGQHVYVNASKLARVIETDYDSLTLARKNEVHLRVVKLVRAICDRHVQVTEESRKRRGKSETIIKGFQPVCAWHGFKIIESTDGIQRDFEMEIEPKDWVLSKDHAYYIQDGLAALNRIPARGQAGGNWAIQIAQFLQEKRRKKASRSENSRVVMATRWEIITEYTGNPDPWRMRVDKVSRMRIRDYYCKALRTLTEVGLLLPEGDAEMVNGSLRAQVVYENITGTRNKMDEWLKQTVTLHVTDDLDPNNVLETIAKKADRLKSVASGRSNRKPST